MQNQETAVKRLRLHNPAAEDTLMQLRIQVLEGMEKREAAFDLVLRRSPMQF